METSMSLPQGEWKLLIMDTRNWTANCSVVLSRYVTSTYHLQAYLLENGWCVKSVNEYEKGHYKAVLVRRDGRRTGSD